MVVTRLSHAPARESGRAMTLYEAVTAFGTATSMRLKVDDCDASRNRSGENANTDEE